MDVVRTSVLLTEHNIRVDKQIAWYLRSVDLIVANHAIPDNIVVDQLNELKDKILVDNNLSDFVEVKQWAESYINYLVMNLES